MLLCVLYKYEMDVYGYHAVLWANILLFSWYDEVVV
jgi:hypothetical protein